MLAAERPRTVLISPSIPARKTFCNCRRLGVNGAIFKKADDCSYNIRTLRHFRTPLAPIELLEKGTRQQFFADLCEPWKAGAC